MAWQTHWLISQCLTFCLIAAAAWILTATLHYGLKNKKFKNIGRRRKKDLNGGTVYLSATMAVVCLLPRYFASQVVLLVSAHLVQNSSCERTMDTANVCYSVSVTSAYLFLWFRQQSFYSHPVLGKLAGNAVKIISFMSLVVLSLAAATVALFFVLPISYKNSDHGCVLLNANESKFMNGESVAKNDNTIVYGMFATLVFSQFLLLGLFINPLLRKKKFIQSPTKEMGPKTSQDSEKQDKRRSRIGSAFTSARQFSKRVFNGNANSIYKTIRRSVVCAMVALLTDLIAMLFAVMVSNDTPRHVTNLVYDLSMLINVLCVLASFTKWLEIITSPCRTLYIPRRQPTPTTSSDGL